MTRKDETAGKAIVNGSRGYRERASRCEATEGQAGRDTRRRGGAARRKGRWRTEEDEGGSSVNHRVTRL